MSQKFSMLRTEREKAAFQKALAALDGLTLDEAWSVAAELEGSVKQQRDAFWRKAVAQELFNPAAAASEWL